MGGESDRGGSQAVAGRVFRGRESVPYRATPRRWEDARMASASSLLMVMFRGSLGGREGDRPDIEKPPLRGAERGREGCG